VESLKQFLDNYRVQKFSRGEIILFEGEVPSCAYVIRKGIVKTYNLTSEGQEKPISFDIEMETFPVGWVFGKLRSTHYFYEAFTDCSVFCVPRDEFLDFLKKNTKLLYTYFDYFVSRYLNYQMRINALEQSKAADKVLHTIYFLCIRFGQELRKDVVKIQLPLTQQDLANFMGLTRETTGIELKRLEKAGVITYHRQNYIVKTDKLNDLLDDEYESMQLIGMEE
jgi:CRP/FNR family transcriptional regulator